MDAAVRLQGNICPASISKSCAQLWKPTCTSFHSSGWLETKLIDTQLLFVATLRKPQACYMVLEQSLMLELHAFCSAQYCDWCRRCLPLRFLLFKSSVHCCGSSRLINLTLCLFLHARCSGSSIPITLRTKFIIRIRE